MAGTPENKIFSPLADEALKEYIGVLLKEPERARDEKERIMRHFPSLIGVMNVLKEIRSEDLDLSVEMGEEAEERVREKYDEAVQEYILGKEENERRAREIVKRLEPLAKKHIDREETIPTEEIQDLLERDFTLGEKIRRLFPKSVIIFLERWRE